MIKRKKPPILDFTIDVSEFSASDSLPQKRIKDGKLVKTKKASTAEIATSKANKRKTKSKMFDEELAQLGIDPDDAADSEDFGDGDRPRSRVPESDLDDGLESTKPRRVKKKKRRPAGTALAIVQPQAKNRISKIDTRKVKSIVGDDADRMLSMLEDDDSLDAAIKLIKRRLLQTMIDMIPQLETSMRNSDGRYGAHALNGSIQTIRELIIDLESAADRGAIGESIVERVIRPSIAEIATSIMEEHAAVLSEVKDLMPDETYREVRKAQIESRNRLAVVITSKYEAMRADTIGYLQR